MSWTAMASSTRNTSALLSSMTTICHFFGSAGSGGDGEEEGRSFPKFRLDPDTAAISIHDSLAEGQPNAAAGIFFVAVEALEESKDSLLVGGTNTNAVILYPKQPVTIGFLSRDRDLRSLFPPVLDGISNQVLK